jgi:hypothetical protein
LEAPAIGDHRSDQDPAHVRYLDRQGIDDAQRASGFAERASVDAHALDRVRFELEADLARGCLQGGPRVVTLADRMCQALQTPVPIFGRIKRGLYAFHFARLFAREALRLGSIVGQRGLGGVRGLALVLRCKERGAQRLPAALLGLNLRERMAPRGKGRLRLADLGVPDLQPVASGRELGELLLGIARAARRPGARARAEPSPAPRGRARAPPVPARGA